MGPVEVKRCLVLPSGKTSSPLTFTAKLHSLLHGAEVTHKQTQLLRIVTQSPEDGFY